jgi:SAM-dependent methyltransferase
MPHCPICNKDTADKYCTATDAEYFTTTRNFDFYSCAACEVLFIHPMPVDQLQMIYPANYYSFTPKTQSLAFRVKDFIDSLFYKRILKRIPAKKLRVLDIGGGTGNLLNTIKKADARITYTEIIDLDENARAAAEKNGHQYYCGTIESFQGNTLYDVILMLNLIEHVADPFSVLNKAAALLSPDGVIIIKTPNYKSLDAVLYKSSYWGGLHCPRHWVLFTKNSFSNMADSAGLATKKFSYTQGAPFWSISILHRMRTKKWIRADKDHPLIYHPLFAVISVFAAAFDFARKPFAPLSQMFFVLHKKDR